MFTDMATGLPQVKAGKLRALGVTPRQRSALAPEVPTIEEAGVKGYEATYWFAAYAPAGTPAPVVARLNEMLHKAAHGSAQAAFYQPTGTEVYLNTPEEQRKFQAAESQKWGRIIKAAGIEPE
jgi:tripartite-type tricarboxylate transporter receptor subunit TctC